MTSLRAGTRRIPLLMRMLRRERRNHKMHSLSSDVVVYRVFAAPLTIGDTLSNKIVAGDTPQRGSTVGDPSERVEGSGAPECVRSQVRVLAGPIGNLWNLRGLSHRDGARAPSGPRATLRVRASVRCAMTVPACRGWLADGPASRMAGHSEISLAPARRPTCCASRVWGAQTRSA